MDGFWVKSVFLYACLPPVPSAGVTVSMSVCRNGNKIRGESGEGLDRVHSFTFLEKERT